MGDRRTALVLSGGVALGSYQAGVYEALANASQLSPSWIAGSSVGALNGALIVGTPPEERFDVLRSYWLRGPESLNALSFGMTRHALNWVSAVQARLFGALGHIQTLGPRLSFGSFYDLGPTVEFLKKTIDFGRLNAGDIRFTVATTDIESGESVLFDTGKGDRIEIDHILASCGFLPEFAPVEIGGRLLGDGGLSMNAPVEPVLDELAGTEDTMIVADLFARDGARPVGLQEALARKNAILFGNQTWYRLEAYRRLWQRDLADGRLAPSTLYLSYLPVSGEAGPEAPYDFSLASARDRWAEGFLDGRHAVAQAAAGDAAPGTTLAIRRSKPAGTDAAVRPTPLAA
jgi:NTE family protein